VVDYRLKCLERGHTIQDRASPACSVLGEPAAAPIATSPSRST
jgi:hypothetical protein